MEVRSLFVWWSGAFLGTDISGDLLHLHCSINSSSAREVEGCQRFCFQMESCPQQPEKLPARRTRSLCTDKLLHENGNDPIKAKISWSKSNEEHSIDIDQTNR